MRKDFSLLSGSFPFGIPVLIHSQFNCDSLETRIGLVIRCTDALNLAEVYYGKIDAIVAAGSGSLEIENGIDHFSKRTSACYWVHIRDAEKMIEDFSKSWNNYKVKETIERLMASI